MTITIGAEAINRAARWVYSHTYLNLEGAADGAGEIHTVYIWPESDMTGLKVGIFYSTGDTKYKCRSAATLGDAGGGGKRTFSGLSLAVEVGDIIGCYFAAGYIEKDSSGFAGIMYDSTIDNCVVDSEETYSLLTGDAMSLQGIGVAVTVGRGCFSKF